MTQKELFARTIKVASSDAVILKDMLEEINLLGFDIREFGSDTFVINGIPANTLKGINEQELIDMLIEQYKMNIGIHTNIKENIARSLAYSACIKKGKSLSEQEMRVIIDELFACKMPYKGPNGKNCFTTFDLTDLAKRFDA